MGHILEELHDIKHLISREIFENAEIIFEPAKFKGRYGVENDALFEVREVYNRVEADIRRLVAETGINSNIPIYQFQSWFYSALAQKEVVADGDKFPGHQSRGASDQAESGPVFFRQQPLTPLPPGWRSEPGNPP